MKDWMIRAIKTFFQSFGGALIPALCALLNGGFPESIHAGWVVLSPVIAAGLSAGIAAVWNYALETWKKE